jgi:hypothetical protein
MYSPCSARGYLVIQPGSKEKRLFLSQENREIYRTSSKRVLDRQALATPKHFRILGGSPPESSEMFRGRLNLITFIYNL